VGEYVELSIEYSIAEHLAETLVVGELYFLRANTNTPIRYHWWDLPRPDMVANKSPLVLLQVKE